MHLLPVYWTTSVTTSKRRKQKRSNKQKAVDAAHAKFLRKMGYKRSCSLTVKHRAYTPQVSRLESDLGSNPSETTNSPNKSQADQFYNETSAKKTPNVYNGKRKLIGIATMHKSNLQPIWSKEQAKDAATMRRN